MNSTPHRRTKTNLATLAALLTLAATAQAFAPTSAAAMDDNGTGSCVLLFIPGMGSAYYDENGNVCEPPGGGSDEEETKNWPMVGNEDIEVEVKPKAEPPRNPRADGCYLGCLAKTNKPQRDREGRNLFGAPDDRPGGSAERPINPRKKFSRDDCQQLKGGELRLEVDNTIDRASFLLERLHQPGWMLVKLRRELDRVSRARKAMRELSYRNGLDLGDEATRRLSGRNELFLVDVVTSVELQEARSHARSLELQVEATGDPGADYLMKRLDELFRQRDADIALLAKRCAEQHPDLFKRSDPSSD